MRERNGSSTGKGGGFTQAVTGGVTVSDRNRGLRRRGDVGNLALKNLPTPEPKRTREKKTGTRNLGSTGCVQTPGGGGGGTLTENTCGSVHENKKKQTACQNRRLRVVKEAWRKRKPIGEGPRRRGKVSTEKTE